MEEMAEAAALFVADTTARLKSGRYPFIIKDGGRVVGSADALERWIAARASGANLAVNLPNRRKPFNVALIGGRLSVMGEG